MDDGRGPGVEEVKAFQDLPAPTSQHLRLHHFETLQVALEKETKETSASSELHSNSHIQSLPSKKKTVNQAVHLTTFNDTHVFSVPDVISSVTKTIHFFPLRGDSQKS